MHIELRQRLVENNPSAHTRNGLKQPTQVGRAHHDHVPAAPGHHRNEPNELENVSKALLAIQKNRAIGQIRTVPLGF